MSKPSAQFIQQVCADCGESLGQDHGWRERRVGLRIAVCRACESYTSEAAAELGTKRIRELEGALRTIAEWTHNEPYGADATIEGINDFAARYLRGEAP